MDEDGTSLLDVMNDPDALGAFFSDGHRDESATGESMESMDFTGGDSGGSSKPAYPDFLSMAMAEAELEPDYGGLDEAPFLSGTVDSAELGGIPEQRTLGSLVDEEEKGTVSLGGAETSQGGPSLAVHRMISQSSQPLQHGALPPDIPTQKVIHYTAQDHPPVNGEEMDVQPTQPTDIQGTIQSTIIQGTIQPSGVQQALQTALTHQGIRINGIRQAGLQQTVIQQQIGIQQAGINRSGIQSGGPQQAGIQMGRLHQAGVQSSGLQQTGTQQNVIQSGGLQQVGIQPGKVQQLSGMQLTGISQGGLQPTTGIQQGRLQQATGMQQGGLQQTTGIPQGGLHLTGAQQGSLQQAAIQQGGVMQQTGLPQTTGIQQSGLQQSATGIQQGILQQSGLQQTTGIPQAGLQQAGIQQGGLQQAGIQQGGLQQVIIGQGTAGNLQQLVLGPSQILNANMLGGQGNILPQGLVQLGRHQLRPKMGVVLKQGGSGGMVYDASGANKGLKQVLVLNPHTGVLSQVPGNIQLTGQLTIPHQSSAGVMGSPQVIQIQQPGQKPSKVKTSSITATATSTQPVITVAASEGNIIVLRNSTPLFTPASSSTGAVQKSGSVAPTKTTSSSSSSSGHSTAAKSKSSKSKSSKSKGKSRSRQQKSSTGSKPVMTITMASVTNSSASSAGHTRSVQSLGTIPSIQTSSPLPVTTMFPPGLTSTAAPINSFVNTSSFMNTSVVNTALVKPGTTVPTTSTTAPNTSTTAPNTSTTIPKGKGLPSSFAAKSGSSTMNLDKAAPIVTRTNNSTTTESSTSGEQPSPVISHQTGTVHYRPRQAVPRGGGNQGDRNPALQQLVQNLRAQGDNERLRSLQKLQRLLQQNPQASQQLQELMKSKLGGTEVAMEKLPPSTLGPAAAVTKPPNVYLTPQQTVAESILPSFQTTGSKLFPGSIPSIGSTPEPGRKTTPNGATNTTPQRKTAPDLTPSSNLETLSGILSSVATQASGTKPPPATNVRSTGDKNGSAGNSSINLDFLTAKPSPLSSTSQLTCPNQSAPEARSGSIPFSAFGNSLLNNTIAPPRVSPGSQQQPPVTNAAGLLSSLSPGGGSAPAMSPFATAGPSSAFSGLLSPGQSTSLPSPGQSGTLPSPGQSAPLPSPGSANPPLSSTPVTQGRPAAAMHPMDTAGAKTSAIHDPTHRQLGGVVGAPPPTGGPQTNPQISQAGGAAAGRQTVTMTAEQLGIRAQLQLQQIQMRVQHLLQKPARTEQENRLLQQLLLYRNKMIAKVKAHLAQLNHQQRLAALSMVQQIRARAQNQNAGKGPMHSPTASPSGGSMPSSLPGVPTSNAPSGAAQNTKAGGAFSSLPIPPQNASNTSSSSGLSVSLNDALSIQASQLSPHQISPTPLASPPGSSRQIQNARITSTTSRQEGASRGEKQKAGGEGERRTSSKKLKVTNTEPPPLLHVPSSGPSAGGLGPELLRAKLRGESSLLGKSAMSAAAPTTAQGQSTLPLTEQQLKSQQYQHTMKMLEEKLRSMSPAQQREFLLQYQPLLHKFTQAGQKIMADKNLEGAGGILNSANKAKGSSQRTPTQGNSSKDGTSFGKQSASKSKSSTPTLLQLITEGNRSAPESKSKKHEKKTKPPPSKPELLAKQLKRERNLVTRTEMKKGFKSRSDAVSKLLAFHITQDTSPTTQHLEQFDKDFEECSTQLLQKKGDMLEKYRHLLLKESMRRGPSAEMVMLDRMVLQDEKLNVEYEKQLAKNPETQNRLLAIIKPNQSKKQRFLQAAVTLQTTSVPTALPTAAIKQEPCLPPKKRVHLETMETKPVAAMMDPRPAGAESTKPEPRPEVKLEVKPEPLQPPPKSPETPIKEPQITKNDFRTKITIKIPKASYRPPSPAPSSGDTLRSSSLSSPDLISPRSDVGLPETPVVVGVKGEKSPLSPRSPRVRLRRHSTLQALLMSDSPLEVNIDELKGGGKKTPVSPYRARPPLPLVHTPVISDTSDRADGKAPLSHAGNNFIPTSLPPPLIRNPSDPSSLPSLLQTWNHKQHSSLTAQSRKTAEGGVVPTCMGEETTGHPGKDKAAGKGRKAGKAAGRTSSTKDKGAMSSGKGKANLRSAERGRGGIAAPPRGGEVLTNGKRGFPMVPSSDHDMSVFDFDETTTRLRSMAPDNPFEPMDLLQDSLQDEMNSTINSILGLQRPSPGEGDHGGLMSGRAPRGALPSAIFESYSGYDDDEFYDSALDGCSYGSVGSDVGGDTGSAEAASGGSVIGGSLQSELDIMMEDDEMGEGNDT